MNDEDPTWICWDCGRKACSYSDMNRMSTYHQGICDICKETKAVTQARDFGYSRLNKKQKFRGNL